MRRVSTGLAVVMSLLLILVGCGQPSKDAPPGGQKGGAAQPNSDDARKGPIKIGAIIPLSGREAEAGQRMKAAFNMAVDEINAAGGVLNRPLQMVYGDDQDNVEVGVKAGKKLLQEDKVFALTGFYRSGILLGVAPLAAENKTVTMVSDATAEQLNDMVRADYNKNKYLFRNGAPVTQFMTNTLPFITDVVKAKTFYYVGEDLAWAKDLGGKYKATLEAKGIKLVGEKYFPLDAQDFTPIILDIKAKNPDVVVTANTTKAILTWTRQYNQHRVSVPFVSQAGILTTEDIVKSAGADADYAFFMALGWDMPITPKTQTFYKTFKEKTGYSALGYEDIRSYDAIYLLAEGIKQAGKVDSDEVVKVLEKLHWTGAAGAYSFDDGHQAYIPGVVGQWKGGKATIVVSGDKTAAEMQKAPWWK